VASAPTLDSATPPSLASLEQQQEQGNDEEEKEEDEGNLQGSNDPEDNNNTLSGGQILESKLGKLLFINLLQHRSASKRPPVQVATIKGDASKEYDEWAFSARVPNGTDGTGALYFCKKQNLLASEFVRRVHPDLVLIIQEGKYGHICLFCAVCDYC